MAPMFAKDYNTIKSSPTKDRDDISFEDTKTNGYSIVRSAMLAVIIAIVAVVGVVTFHQSPSLSNGYDSSMSTMAVTPTSEKPVSTASPSPSEPDPDLRVCEISGQYPISGCVCPPGPSCGHNPAPTCICNFCCADSCGNLNNMSFRRNIPSYLLVSTSGCGFLQNGRVTGQFSVTVEGTRRPPISLRDTSMNLVLGGTYNVPTGTLVASFAASSPQGGTVRIQMNWSGRNGRNAVEGYGISGLPSF